MIKDILETLRDGNKLKNYVLDYYIDECDFLNDEELIISMQDLLKYGCVSGMIRDLIYYDDTNRFYDIYKDDINDLLSELQQETGLSIEELFSDKFDKDDPLIINCLNKNLMAWFGFEETTNKIYDMVCEKMKNADFEFCY